MPLLLLRSDGPVKSARKRFSSCVLVPHALQSEITHSLLLLLLCCWLTQQLHTAAIKLEPLPHSLSLSLTHSALYELTLPQPRGTHLGISTFVLLSLRPKLACYELSVPVCKQQKPHPVQCTRNPAAAQSKSRCSSHLYTVHTLTLTTNLASKETGLN